MVKVSFCTLGCKVNQYETEVLKRWFAAAGFRIVSDGEAAEVCIVNSCTVTAEGDKKTKQLLRRLRRDNPTAILALAGCYPQAFPEEAAQIAEADIVCGTRNRGSLLTDVQTRLSQKEKIVHIPPHEENECFEPMEADRFTDHTRAFVKIEDGCDRKCAYCVIPRARGPIRSKRLADIETELAGLAGNGYHEIVLVGINLSSYGRETGQSRLAQATARACAIPGIERVRLGSLEPELLTGEDIDLFTELPEFCPQFHLALQSGCEATLRRMGRCYTPDEYWWICELIRARFDGDEAACRCGAAITTDVMVGFPGETEDEFEQSLAFVGKMGFAAVHVFPYSRREGTRAAAMPDQVPPEIKEERARRMAEAAARARAEFMESQKGLLLKVLFEARRQDGLCFGHTMNNIPVVLEHTDELRGRILAARLGDYDIGRNVCQGRLEP